MEGSEQPVRKSRSQAAKVGKHKYEVALLHRLDGRIQRLEYMMRTILIGLQRDFKFERPFVEKIACESDMDFAVVSAIYEAGGAGILAKNIAGKLQQYPLEQHKILRVVNRVNRNVEAILGRGIIEKRGKKWGFTNFGLDIWGLAKEEIQEEKARQAEPLDEEENE